MFFKESGASILVDVPLIELYIPHDYMTTLIPNTNNRYYEVVGENVSYFGIVNFKVFKSEKDRDENIDTVLTYPMGVPAMVLSRPSDIDIRDMRFNKHSPVEKMIVLTFNKGDQFVVNTNVITTADNLGAITARFKGGKLTNIPPLMSDEVIIKSQEFNNVSLKLPSEMFEIYAAERYRDPNNPAQKLRFSDARDTTTINNPVSYNMREESMQSSSYQAISGEDINSAIITATNRKNAGIKDEATLMEKIIRGEKIDPDNPIK